MKNFHIAILLTASALSLPTGAPAQEQSMPGMQMPSAQTGVHHHHAARMHDADYPRFGQAQKEPGQKLFRLEDVQQTARAKNPTLRQAEAAARQAGLLS